MSGRHGVRAVRAFRSNHAMREAVARELADAYADTDYEITPVDVVIDRALAVVASDTRERAADQQACSKVDDCTATAVVLRALADWLSAS